MACSCRNKTQNNVDIPYDKMPDEECIYCAEKHVAAAMQLIAENGYERMNRQRIIGELVLAQWHIYKVAYDAAVLLRDIRHLVQNRKESEITSAMFERVCEKLDALISADIASKADAGTNVNSGNQQETK